MANRVLLSNSMEGNNRVLRYDDGTAVSFGGDPEAPQVIEEPILDVISRMSLTELGKIKLSQDPVIVGGWYLLSIVGTQDIKKAKLNEFKDAIVAAGIMDQQRANNLFKRNQQT